MEYEVIGELLSKEETKHRGSSDFAMKNFVIRTEAKYPQVIKLGCIKDMCEKVDQIKIGSKVICHFDLRGYEWNDKIITNLNCYRIKVSDNGAGSEPTTNPGVNSRTEPVSPGASQSQDPEEDLPF